MSRYGGRLGELFAADDSMRRTKDQVDLIHHVSLHPWNLVTAEYHDPLTRHNLPLVRTRDESNTDRSQRIRPFPTDPVKYPHVKPALDLLYDPPRTRDGRFCPILIPKARRSIISYLVCTFELWEWLHVDASNWINAKHDKGDAQRLMYEKIQCTYDLLPDFFRSALPCRFAVGDAGYQSPRGGLITPAESGFHVGSGLGVAASYFFDEAPLMKQLRAAYTKILPTAALLVLAGTPPGAEDDYEPDSLEFFASFFEDRVELDTEVEDDE